LSLPKFIYFLTEKDGRTRQVVNGVVTSLTQPKALPNAPDGNQEIAIGWERSPMYHGNIRNFSIPLGFVTDGATILRNDFYKFNLDRELYLLVKRLTYETNTIALTYKEFYKQLYKGQLDFATAVDDQGGYRFNIGIMEGGLQSQLKANESTSYELPFDLDAKNITMDGVVVQQNARFLNPAVTLNTNQYIMPISFISAETYQNSSVAFFTSQFEDYPGGPLYNFSLSENYFLRTTATVTVRIRGTIGVTHAGSYQFWIAGSSNTAIDPTNYPAEPGLYWMDTAAGLGETSVFTFDLTLDLPADEKLYFYTNHPFDTEDIYTDTDIFVEFLYRAPETNIKGFTLYDAARKLTEKITGSADNFESDFLQDLVADFGSEIILTSGDGVRSIDGAALKTNWREFWKFADTVLSAEMTITDKIRIAKRIEAYQPESVTPAIELGDIKGLKVTPAVDQMYTSVKVGHAEPKADDVNGKFAFNGHFIFNTPVKAITDKQLDLQTNYKADPFEIDATRANYDGKTTTDKDTDNDTFALAVQPAADSDSFDTLATFQAVGAPFTAEPLLSISAGLPELRAGMKIRITGSALNDQDLTIKSAGGWFFGQLIITNEPLVDELNVNITIEILEGQLYELDRDIAVTQLITPTDVVTEIKESLFNVRLSPKRILLRNASTIAGGLVQYAPGSLVFADANRNKELIAGGIIEKADVLITALGAPMFLPTYFEFDVISPVDMPAILEENPNPVFAFTWKDERYTGFFIRGGIALNDLEEQTFKLLACPDNNLLNLI